MSGEQYGHRSVSGDVRRWRRTSYVTKDLQNEPGVQREGDSAMLFHRVEVD